MSLVETCVLWGTPLIHWQAGFVHLLCTEATCPAGQVSAHRQPGRAQAWRARGLSDGGAHTSMCAWWLVSPVPGPWPPLQALGAPCCFHQPAAAFLRAWFLLTSPDPNAGVPQGLSVGH